MRLFDAHNAATDKLARHYGPLLQDLNDFVAAAQASESKELYRSPNGKRFLDNMGWANKAIDVIHLINRYIQKPEITDSETATQALNNRLQRSIRRYVRINMFSLPGIIKKHLPLNDQHAAVFWEPHFPRSSHHLALIVNQLPTLQLKSEFIYFMYRESSKIFIDVEEELHLLLKIPYRDYVASASEPKLNEATLARYENQFYPKLDETTRDTLKQLIHLIDGFEENPHRNTYQINKAWCFIATLFCEWSHPEKSLAEKTEALHKTCALIEKEFFPEEKLEDGWVLIDENASLNEEDEIPLRSFQL